MVIIANTKCPNCGEEFEHITFHYDTRKIHRIIGWCGCGLTIDFSNGEEDLLGEWNEMLNPTLKDLEEGEKLMEKIKKGVPLDGRSKL